MPQRITLKLNNLKLDPKKKNTQSQTHDYHSFRLIYWYRFQCVAVELCGDAAGTREWERERIGSKAEEAI